MKKDVLFFVEDPGAANFIAPLPEELKKRGITSSIFAEKGASTYLKSLAITSVCVPEKMTPDEIIKTVRPGLVLIGTAENPDTLGLQLINATRRAGISSVGVVDAVANAQYRFKGCGETVLNHAPDWLFVQDEDTKKSFSDLGFSSKRIFVCGNPHYDYVRKKTEVLKQTDRDNLRSRFFPRAPGNATIAVFASEMSNGFNPKQFELSSEYTLFGREGSVKRTRIVLEEFFDSMRLLPERPYLVMRLHPKDKREEYEDYFAEFDMFSWNEPVYDLIYAADCIFGMTSMILLEAAIIGRPTFSILPREVERQWLPSIRGGVTQCATTRKELELLLPPFFQSVSSPQPFDVDDFFVFGASARVAALIEGILGKAAFFTAENCCLSC